jgi:hypothetical protein
LSTKFQVFFSKIIFFWKSWEPFYNKAFKGFSLVLPPGRAAIFAPLERRVVRGIAAGKIIVN